MATCILSFIEIYWVFSRLPLGIVAYDFTLFWTTFVETVVYRVLNLGRESATTQSWWAKGWNKRSSPRKRK